MDEENWNGRGGEGEEREREGWKAVDGWMDVSEAQENQD
jgi:hypothetical protein